MSENDVSLPVEASENQATQPLSDHSALNSALRDLVGSNMTCNMDETQIHVGHAQPWQEWFPRIRSNSNASIPSLESLGSSNDAYTINLGQILGARGPVNDEDAAILALFLEYTHDLDQALHKYGFRICKEAWRRVLMDRKELMENDLTGDLYERVIGDRALRNDEAEM